MIGNIATGYWNIILGTQGALTQALENGIPLPDGSLEGFQAAHSRLLDQLVNTGGAAPNIAENLAAEGLRLAALRKTQYQARVKNAALKRSLQKIGEELKKIDPAKYTNAVRQGKSAGEYTPDISTKIYWSVVLGQRDSLAHLLQDARFPAGFVALQTYQAFLAVGTELLQKLADNNPKGDGALKLIPMGLDFYEVAYAGTNSEKPESAARRKLKKITRLLPAVFREEEYARAVAQLRSLGGPWYFAPTRWVTAPALVPANGNGNGHGRLFGEISNSNFWDRMNHENPELYERVQEINPDDWVITLQEIAVDEIRDNPSLSSAAIHYLIQAAFALESTLSIAALFDLLGRRPSLFQREHAQLLQELDSKIKARAIQERHQEFQKALRAAMPELHAGDSAA